MCIRDRYGLVSTIGPRSRKHLHSASSKSYRQFDDLDVFFIADGGGFPSGSHGHDSVDARLNLSFDQFLKSIFIDVPVFERCYNSSVSSCKHELKSPAKMGLG